VDGVDAVDQVDVPGWSLLVHIVRQVHFVHSIFEVPGADAPVMIA
jgi:hypothetical protein